MKKFKEITTIGYREGKKSLYQSESIHKSFIKIVKEKNYIHKYFYDVKI